MKNSVLRFTFTLVAILFMFSVTTITSCSKDDDNSSNPIVGTWVRTESKGDGYYTESYTFRANGSGTWEIKGTWQNEKSEFYYSFNSTTSEITFTEDGETWTEVIESFDGTKFKFDGGWFYKK